MFLKISALKKAMVDVLKRGDLHIANDGEDYIVFSRWWGVSVRVSTAPNKFMALIVELVGELPEAGACWQCEPSEMGVSLSDCPADMPNPFSEWKKAKEPVLRTQLDIMDVSHEYVIFQKKSDKQYLLARRDLTEDLFSAKELMPDESMPVFPTALKHGSLEDDYILYYKSDESIYWISTTTVTGKARDALFSALSACDFYEEDWKAKPEEPAVEEEPEGGRPDSEAPDDVPLPFV